MRSRRVSIGFVVCAVLSLTAAACSSSSGESATSASNESSTSDASTTTVAPSTTTSATVAPSTTTTVAPTTSTTVVVTTTTAPIGASIDLRSDGIGDALFGAAPEGVISYLTHLLGAPNSDTGWVSAPERTCPGTEVRSMSWGDLALLFGDESSVSSGRRHFFSWSYGPVAGTVISPFGMATPAPARISVGSTVGQLTAAYPLAKLSAGDELVGPSASIADGLLAFVTDITPAGVVTSLVGGFGCGE